MSELQELKDENKKMRLELNALRCQKSKDDRFIWWIWNVYAKHVQDLLLELDKTALPITPFGAMPPFGISQSIKYLKEYTEHIYDGTYLDVAMSVDVKISSDEPIPSNSTDLETKNQILKVQKHRI